MTSTFAWARPRKPRPPVPDVSTQPFRPPLEPAPIVIDLPPPLSVNRLRRIDWAAEVRNTAWKRNADSLVLMAKRRKDCPLKLQKIERFELTLTFDENQTGIDLDNGVKGVIDYLCHVEVIAGDAPKHLRRLVVEWGYAPEGCRVLIAECP